MRKKKKPSRNFNYKISRHENNIEKESTLVNGVEYLNITNIVRTDELFLMCRLYVVDIKSMQQTGRDAITAHFEDLIKKYELPIGNEEKPFFIWYNGQDIQVYALESIAEDMIEALQIYA